SEGPNQLLKMGAKPATSAGDILEDLPLKMREVAPERGPKKTSDLSAEELRLLQFISFDPITTNELVENSGIQPGVASALLTLLEIKGAIRAVGPERYAKCQ